MYNLKTINEIKYLDALNQLDELVNNLLYSEENGFINLLSKDAVENYYAIISKYDYESEKIAQKLSDKSIIDDISQKKDQMMIIVNKHINKQIETWSYQVMQKRIGNLILKLLMYKNSKKEVLRFYNDALNTIKWFSNLNNYTLDNFKILVNEFNSKLINTLHQDDNKKLMQNKLKTKSDSSVFMRLWNLIDEDFDEFLLVNFDNYKTELSPNDINCLNKIQNGLNLNKITSLDNINMINFALKNYNITDVKNKHELILQIFEDFQNLKSIDEKDKIDIINRRINLYLNKNEYYRKLFAF